LFSGLTQLPEGQIIAFALVLLRIVAFVIAWPIFGTNSVPVTVKVLLAVILSMLVFPTLTNFQNAAQIKFGDEIIFMSIRELGVGLMLGFLMRLFFFAISIAGEIISVSIGLGSAQLFNPAMGSSGSAVEQFEIMLASLFFLVMNGHHVFLAGLGQSFTFVPISDVGINTASFGGMAQIITDVFLMGLKISAPVLVAIFLTNVSMGILGRAVPQVNVLVTSLPVTLMLGFAVLLITTPLFVGEMSGMITSMADNFFKMMKAM
jgi:flagellar biosynthesis protein FliR